MYSDLYKVVNTLDPLQQEIVRAELAGMTYKDIGMSKKTWRYHRQKAFEIIKQHLGDK